MITAHNNAKVLVIILIGIELFFFRRDRDLAGPGKRAFVHDLHGPAYRRFPVGYDKYRKVRHFGDLLFDQVLQAFQGNLP